MKRLIIFASLLLMSLVAGAQQVNMPVAGHKDTTCATLTVVDDGQGPGGSYSPRGNSSWTVHTTRPGSVFQVKTHHDFYRERGRAYYEVLDGDTNSGNVLYCSDWNWRLRFCYSSGNTVTIVFHSDDDDPQGNWDVELCESGGDAPWNVHVTPLGGDSVLLSWEESDTAIHWAIDYALGTTDIDYGFADPNRPVFTVYSDTTFIILTNIDDAFAYNIYPLNDTPCGHGLAGGGCPCVGVENIRRTYDQDSIYFDWDNNADYWALTLYDERGEWHDTMVYTNHWATPIDNDLCWDFYFEVWGGNCQYTRCNGWSQWYNSNPVPRLNSYGWYGASDTSLYIRWDDDPYWHDPGLPTEWWGMDTSDVVIYYREASMPEDSLRVWDTLRFSQLHSFNGDLMGMDTIFGLRPHTAYYVEARRLMNGVLSCPTGGVFNTAMESCVNYINIWDYDRVHLTWGTYQDPYTSVNGPGHYGVYDNILFDGGDRHRAFTDTTECDWSTHDLADHTVLRTIPQGSVASLRLGNDRVGAEAESVTYDYTVDTNDHDLMVLQYALVMQNPGHSPANQPHFTLELLDENGALMDSACCYADFVASGNMAGEGWHYVQQSDYGIPNVMWKDWTTIGINLTPYHGQNIKVRLTNKDCAEGGHFAYAYFTIHCDNKRIVLINRCDSTQYIHMQAPIGFEYQWWKKDDPTHILGTGYDQMVPIDTNVYVCRCSFVGKPMCYFDMECVSVDVRPVPVLTYWVDTCAREAYLCSQSYLEFDTTYAAYTSQCVDSIFWVLDDGSLRWGDTLALALTENRTYNPTLVSRLTDSYCVDSLTQPIEVNFVYQMQVAGPTDLCLGQPLQLTAQVRPVNSPAFAWSTGATDSTIIRTQPLGTRTYTVTVENEGCVDTLTHTVSVHRTYNDTLRAAICQGQRYQQHGFNQNTTGVYTNSRVSMHGCDSVTTLKLQVQSPRDTTFGAVLCHGYYFEYGGQRYSTEGTHTGTIPTTIGCDSVHYTLYLVIPAIIESTDTTVCAGQGIMFGGQYYNRPGEYVQVFEGENGCDSTVVLTLDVHHTFHGIIHDTLCEGEPDWFEGQWIEQPGSYTVHLTTPDGCDSIRTLELTYRSLSDTTLEAVLCHGQRYAVSYHSYGETGVYHDTLCNQYLCDSVITLHLEVTPPRRDTLRADICPGDEYPWAGTTYWQTGSYLALGRDSLGCDTLTELLLTVRPEYRDTIVVTLAEGDTTAPGTYETRLYTTYGCDSIILLIVEAPEPAGIDLAAPTLRLYPNPTSGELRVESGELNVEAIEVYDVHGRPLTTHHSSLTTIDLTAQPAGLYLVRVQTAEGVFTFRVIKK